MLEKGKITALQMAFMMFPTIISTAILVVPNINAKYAGRDMWMVPIWASVVGLFIVYVMYRLHELYPQESFIQSSKHIIGRIPAKLLGLFYVFVYLINDGIIVREYGEFVTGAFLSQTPIIVVMVSMVLVCALAVYSGLETLALSSQIFLPIVITLYFLIILLVIPDLKPLHILPVLENGLAPSFMAAIPTQSWFSEFFDISFLLPFVVNRKKGLQWGFISVLAVMLSMVITNLVTLLLLGDLTAEVKYPFMLAARYISLADFLEHLESISMAIWVLGMFIKICVVYYVLLLILSHWLELKDHRPIVFPLGLVILAFSLWVAPNLQTLGAMISTSLVFFYFAVQVIVPAMLLLIALLRGRLHKQNKPRGTDGPGGFI